MSDEILDKEKLQEIMNGIDWTEETNDTGRIALNEILRLFVNDLLPDDSKTS